MIVGIDDGIDDEIDAALIRILTERNIDFSALPPLAETAEPINEMDEEYFCSKGAPLAIERDRRQHPG
jgi:hypothetical protein